MLPSHWALKPLAPLIHILAFPISVSMAECGEYMLQAMLNDKPGFWRRGPKGEVLANNGAVPFPTEETKKKLWDHTVEATSVA